MRTRSMSVVILLAALAGAGCALPGSALTRVVVDGVVTAEDGGPLPGVQVKVVLPAAYGLKGLDALWGKPGDYGHDDQVRSVTADVEGRFRVEFEPVTWSEMTWVIPPLGTAFQNPPWPRLGLRVEGADEFNLLRASGAGLEVLTYRLPERTPLGGPPAFRVTGRVEPADLPVPEVGPVEGHIVHLHLERTRRP